MKNKKYEDCKTIMNKLAWYWNHRTDIHIEELQSEANVAYCIAANSYDDSVSSFPAYVWNTVNKHLQSFIENEQRSKNNDEIVIAVLSVA